MKPLTTLGDALMAKGASDTLDWRAQLRAEDIPRRPPPSSETRSSRPDRGYVEQPEERINTTTFPPRRREETPTLTTPVALIRFSRDETRPRRPYMDPTTGKLVDPNAPEGKAREEQIEAAERLFEQAPQPTNEQTQTEEAVEVPKAKKVRQTWGDDVKRRAVERVRSGVQQVQVARELGTHPTNITQWMRRFPATEKTQLSRPAPPSGKDTTAAIASMVRSTTRTFETVSRELQEALDRVRELKRELRGLLDE